VGPPGDRIQLGVGALPPPAEVSDLAEDVQEGRGREVVEVGGLLGGHRRTVAARAGMGTDTLCPMEPERELITGDDELGWPIHTDKGEIVLSRTELLTTIGKLGLVALFIVGLEIAKTGWTAGHQRPAWPMHFVYATIAWTVFTVPVGWVAWSFWRVIRLLAADDAATERLRALRKAQEIEDRERRDLARQIGEIRGERRRRGRERAREIAERRRVLEGQERIEDELA
jgi:hypothetical protein